MSDRQPTPGGGAEAAPSPGASLDEAMALARPGPPASLLLAQARITEALFGTAPDVGLGRFRVVRRLGQGGMGVVYAAYDPDLDRGVALKLVDVPTGGRDVALAEAKALARLSHPNVVPVFDVGLDGDHVYIVMELVRGETLRAWVEGREVRHVLEAYRQAGLGLAAAHAAGLVHRDFKPDNAVVGADGRVRVVDFGLACEAAEPGRPSEGRRPVAGTPHYMAPEQAEGRAVTAAADQFSFCRSLREALTRPGPDGAPRPPPRWLVAILERGLAADPAARYPSMRELLRALDRDPATLWRRRLRGAALGLAGAAAAFVVGRVTPSSGAEPCSGGAAELAAAWPPEARAAAVARIEGLGAYGKSLAPWLDEALRDFAARWGEGHRSACLDRRRGAQSDALFDRRMACLARGRVALAEAGQIAGAADAKALASVALAVRALPDPGPCADTAALLADVEPPPAPKAERVAAARADLDRARVRLAAGHPIAARDAGVEAVRHARAIGYEPLLAEALLVEGHARLVLLDRAASAPLAEATKVALANRADALAVEAWARHAWVVGTGDEPAAALDGLGLIEAVAARDTSGRFARALLYNNLGSVAMAADRTESARAAFERALQEAHGVGPPGALELVAVRTNSALLADDPARRAELLDDAESELERLLGREHPRTLHARWFRAITSVAELTPAARLVEAICEGHDLHDDLAGQAAACWLELAELRGELGDGAGTLAALERAAAKAAPGEGPGPEIAPHLALTRGDAPAAIGLFARALAPLSAGAALPWWKRLERGELGLGLGRARRATGDEAGARRALEASVNDLAFIAEKRPFPQYERKLARARAELARAMAATFAPAPSVAAVAAPAAAWLRRAGGAASELAALERLAGPR